MYAVKHTNPTDNKLEKLPVISVIRIIPVIGAFTMAVKYAAIASIIKLAIYI